MITKTDKRDSTKMVFTMKNIRNIDAVALCAGKKQFELIDANDNSLHLVVYPSGKKILYSRINHQSKKFSERLGEIA